MKYKLTHADTIVLTFVASGVLIFGFIYYQMRAVAAPKPLNPHDYQEVKNDYRFLPGMEIVSGTERGSYRGNVSYYLNISLDSSVLREWLLANAPAGEVSPPSLWELKPDDKNPFTDQKFVENFCIKKEMLHGYKNGELETAYFSNEDFSCRVYYDNQSARGWLYIFDPL